MKNYWPAIVKNPTGDKATDEFAVAIDNIPKIVFSHTLDKVEWKSAAVEKRDLKEVVLELRQQPGKDIYVGSPGLIAALTQAGLIDEYQLCVHPVIAGNGLPLFKNVNYISGLKLFKTKSFTSGAIILYYESAENKDQGFGL